VSLAAHYTQPSVYFNNLLPPRGLFIPTDSIALVLNSHLTDKAATPSGPNHLDILQNNTRQTGLDTLLALRVDSSTFRLSSMFPADQAQDVAARQPITLTFSGTILPGTIDTSLHANTSLVVTSLYSHGAQIDFEKVIVKNNTATFTPALRFFYNDSVHCYYHAFAARDSLGYPVDVNGDGIAISIFDSLSRTDDRQWHFDIEPVKIVSVKPDSDSRDSDLRARISITFSKPVFASIIDTAITDSNRSFWFTTKYSGGSSMKLDSIWFSADSLTIFFKPESTLFSNDSVRCYFRGISRLYSYDSTSNLPLDTTAVWEQKA
jgi:hypothetical protein